MATLRAVTRGTPHSWPHTSTATPAACPPEWLPIGFSSAKGRPGVVQRGGKMAPAPSGVRARARRAAALEEEQAWAPADTRQSQSLSQPNTVDYRGVLSALGSAARGWGTAHTRWRQPRPPIHARPKPHGKTRWVEAYRGL